jgi:hypothetical protein
VEEKINTELMNELNAIAERLANGEGVRLLQEQ